MAEKSLFWTTNATGDGAAYTQADLINWLRRTFVGSDPANQGVVRGDGSELAVIGAATPLTVGTGSANVYGFPYSNDASVSLAVTTPVVGTTGGRVVLRASWAAQTVRAVAVRNTDGVVGIPALSQVANTTWDIPLATFTIATNGVITLADARQFAVFGTNHVKRAGDTMSGGLTVGGALEVTGALTRAGQTVWNAANDGASSGLDADLLDGMHAAGFWHPGNDGASSGLDADKIHAVQLLPIKRQGLDATNWGRHTGGGGNINASPTTMRMQVGATGINPASDGDQVTITFPQAFAASPVVTFNLHCYSSIPVNTKAFHVYADRFDFAIDAVGSTGETNWYVHWIAVGPS